MELCVIVIETKHISKVMPMILVAYGILLLVYWNCPKYLKAVAFVINFFVPDAVPYIDELVMVAGLISSDR